MPKTVTPRAIVLLESSPATGLRAGGGHVVEKVFLDLRTLSDDQQGFCAMDGFEKKLSRIGKIC